MCALHIRVLHTHWAVSIAQLSRKTSISARTLKWRHAPPARMPRNTRDTLTSKSCRIRITAFIFLFVGWSNHQPTANGYPKILGTDYFGVSLPWLGSDVHCYCISLGEVSEDHRMFDKRRDGRAPQGYRRQTGRGGHVQTAVTPQCNYFEMNRRPSYRATGISVQIHIRILRSMYV